MLETLGDALNRKVLQLLRLKQLHNGVFLKAWAQDLGHTYYDVCP